MNTPDRARAFDHMLLITYSVRPDSEARGYEDWLRRVDNPFFNAAPGFAHYSNWKVTAGTNHFAPHAYFDFVGMNDRDSFDQVWNGAEVNDFRREWRRLWGVEPAGAAVGIQTWLCERTAASTGTWGRHLALVPAIGEPAAGWETWRTRQTLRGSPLAFESFGLRFGSSPDVVEQAGGKARPVLVAECIAAPGVTSG